MSYSAGTMRIIVAKVSVSISRRRPTWSDSHPPSGFANNTTNRVSVFANRKSPASAPLLRRSTAYVNVR